MEKRLLYKYDVLQLYMFIIHFMVGGLIVALTVWLASFVHPKWAGLLAAAPVMTLISYVLMTIKLPKETVQSYMLYAVYFMIPAALCILIIWMSLYRFSFYPSLGFGLITYVIANLLLQYFV